MPIQKHGGGPKKKTSLRTLRVLNKQLEVNPWLTAKNLKENNPQLLENVSVRTVQMRLNDLGYKKVKPKKKPDITEKQKKARLAFCKQVVEWPIEKVRQVLFTDEATFYVSDASGKKVWLKKGQDRYDPKFTEKTVLTFIKPHFPT